MNGVERTTDSELSGGEGWLVSGRGIGMYEGTEA